MFFRVKIIDQLLQSAVGHFLLSKKCRLGLIYIKTDHTAQILQDSKDVLIRKLNSELYAKPNSESVGLLFWLLELGLVWKNVARPKCGKL